MSHHASSGSWWIRNHLTGWNYPVLPTKKELIYRIFRAAYPQGAFVGDDLKLAELREKDDIWEYLQAQINEASNDLTGFLKILFQEEPRLRSNEEKQNVVYKYYIALLKEAKTSLFTSQNGHYLEFRCMEELLVRYKKADEKKWMREGDQPRLLQLPHVEEFQSAQQHLNLQDGSYVEYWLGQLKKLEEPGEQQ